MAELIKSDPETIIFIESCLAGEGGEDADNIANKIAKISGKKVISSTESYSIEDVSVYKYYPFNARILIRGLEGVSDSTYRVNF